MSRSHQTLRRALTSYRSERHALLRVTGLGIAATAAEGLVLVLLVALAQNLGTDAAAVDLWRVEIGEEAAVLISIIGAVVFIASRFAAAAVQARAQTRWEAELRHQIATAYSGASPGVQQGARDNRLVDLTTRLVDHAGVGLVNLASGARAATSAAVLVLTALAVDPMSAAVMAAVSVALLAILRPITARVRAAAAAMTAAGLQTSDEAAELAASARDARLFDVEAHFVDAAATSAAVYERARRRSQTLVAASPVFYQGFGLLLAAAAVGIAIATAGIELQSFGVVAVLLLRTLSYGQHVQSTYQRLVATMAPLDEIDRTLTAWRRAANHNGDAVLDTVHRVELSSVSYAYSDGTQALTSVDLQLDAGSSVAVIGPSGAGKSTLAQLMIRYLRPTSGAVLVNGRPADSFTQESWAANVAFVPQQARLVHANVRDNIGFFRAHVTDDAIVAAARMAGIHDLILALPDGYATTLGPSRRTLSGGQIQRIGIARALAGSPSLLVLDEPTSALDAESESVVIDTLERLPASISVVVIAHRLSTIEHCDAVMVLVEGRVETCADHDVARAESRYYRRALSVAG